ncbi:hypothetical protein NDU88_006416 [Pleurodeles waltl]|uniref:Uncharacterized protein n=1 Tax=Pleurodeles waltl TaxID=8319 RepID=A0AAV7QJ00_PLEWA|nr:hypothetical protein NDU88_006416 [Pleurodeles waltl]
MVNIHGPNLPDAVGQRWKRQNHLEGSHLEKTHGFLDLVWLPFPTAEESGALEEQLSTEELRESRGKEKVVEQKQCGSK